MDTLYRYGLVREATLHALHFAHCRHQRHVQAVLKRLADHGYIGRRFLPPIHRLNTEFLDYSRPDRTGAIYFLAQQGAGLLGVPYHPSTSRVKLAYLHHRLDIADIRACIELAVARSTGLLLAAWIGENDKDEEGWFLLHDQVRAEDPATGQSRRLPIRPDACLVLEEQHTGRQEVFFLEVDEGTESGRRRWHDKVIAYRAYAREGFSRRFVGGDHGFRVLTVSYTPSGTRRQKRLDTLLAATVTAGGRKQFWFTTGPQVMPANPTVGPALRPTGDHILSSPIWQRATAPGLDRDQRLSLSAFLFGRDHQR